MYDKENSKASVKKSAETDVPLQEGVSTEGRVQGADGIWRRASYGAFGFQMIEGDGPEYVITDADGQRVVVDGADGVARVVRIIRGK